jgi:hypothetical protein
MIDYFRECGREPPQRLLDADPNDVFASGYTVVVTSRGFFRGSLPMHKCGRMVDGKYVSLSGDERLQELRRVGKQRNVVSIDPLLDEEGASGG